RLYLSDLDGPCNGNGNRKQQQQQQQAQSILDEVRRAVQAGQRCVVITGAGISVSSGIPDFRSPDGLFQQLKQKYPNSVSTGKDLFDATLFSDPGMVSLFYSFMGELRNLVSRATCTPTHAFIKELDEAGKLLRCYTQNIDSLEKRIGLETSLHHHTAAVTNSASASVDGSEESPDTATPCSSPPSLTSDCSSLDTEDSAIAVTAPLTGEEKKMLAAKRRTFRRRQTTLDKTFTRAVQLHGDLDNVVCTICHTKYPFTEKLAEEFCEGAPPPCPRCKEIEMIRDLVGKRSVASGVLRPDIVLYNENHPQSELIGTLSEYDLKRRPDLLIVIGTSLKIPGIKRMVKEMAHSVHACTLRSKRAGAGKAIFINRDEPPKGWESVFDYYVSGDSDRAISLLPIAGANEPAGLPLSPAQALPLAKVPQEAATPVAMRRRRLPAAKPASKKPNASLSSLLAAPNRRVGAARKLATSGAVVKPERNPRKLTSMLKVVKSSSTSASAKRQQKALPHPASPSVMLPS
ncbi:NAD-dependent deacetylase hst3, partial [Coemansia sp. RSA 1836]